MYYLSLFSGIGACAIGLSPLGFKPIAFSEIADFQSTLLKHHYPTVPNLGNIKDINFKDYKGKLKLIVGGSPCQSFSCAGKGSALDDPRGLLVLDYIRAVNDALPTWFIFENVPGFKKYISWFQSHLDSNYTIEYAVLNAASFGVPQRRKRLFIIGYYGVLSRLTFAYDQHRLYTRAFTTRRVQIAINQDASSPCTPSATKKQTDSERVYAFSQNFGFTTIGEVFPTQLHSNNVVYIIRGSDIRQATIKELERAQGIPDDYTGVMWRGKPASTTIRASAIGNSFVPNVLYWLGNRILELDRFALKPMYSEQLYQQLSFFTKH